MISDNYVVTICRWQEGRVIDAAVMGVTISGGGLNFLYFTFSVNKKTCVVKLNVIFFGISRTDISLKACLPLL